MKQIFWINGGISSDGWFQQPFCGEVEWSTWWPGAPRQYICSPGTMRNLRVYRNSGTHSGTLTLYKNNVATALAASGSASQIGTDLTDSVHFDAGEDCHFTTAGLAAGNLSACFEWEPDTAGETLYGFGGNLVLGRWSGLFQAGSGGNPGNYFVESVAATLIRVPGTITGYGTRHSGGPGTGNTIRYTIYVDGIAQDGSGSTVDTRMTISGSSVTGAVTFSLAVAAGQLVSLYVEASAGSPSNPHSNGTMSFVSSTADKINIGLTSISPIGSSATTFVSPVGFRAGFSASEAALDKCGNPTTSYFTGMTVWRANDDDLGGTVVTFTFRKDGVDTGLIATLSGTMQSASVSGLVEIADANKWALQVSSSGFVDSSNHFKVAYEVGTTAPPPPEPEPEPSDVPTANARECCGSIADPDTDTTDPGGTPIEDQFNPAPDFIATCVGDGQVPEGGAGIPGDDVWS